jgi:pyrimidine-specific ribonucleoside hydrolase
MARNILIDTDPGIDDSLAILMAFASDALKVKGITTVAGNVDIDAVTRNALSLAAMAGSDAPVAAGAEGPLITKRLAASHVHGEDGKGGVALPSPRRERDGRRAFELIRDIAVECRGSLDLVCLGPLTNVALALSAFPYLRKGAIGRIFLMGGSAGPGNATAAAEFNIYADPYAAACVFQAGIPITMCGLDVTNSATLDQADIDGLRRGGGRIAGLCCDMLEYYLAYYRSLGYASLMLHDAVAVAATIDPRVVTTRACHVDVETDGEYTTGKTAVDVLGVSHREPNADVAFNLDHGIFIDLVRRLIGTYS